MTPAIERLKQAGITYQVHRYDPRDVADLGFSEQVAASLEVPAAQVFKTLVCEVETGELIVAVLPGPLTLDMRTLAKASGTKKVAMAHAARAQKGAQSVCHQRR